MVDKNCEMCEILMINVIHNKKRCDECAEKYEREYKKKYLNTYYNKNKKHSYDDCLINFETLINSCDPSLLCPKGFTLRSEISAIATTRLLKKKWFVLLDEYNKIDELYNYVKDEYIKHYELTNDANVQKFVKEHEIITQDVTKYFGNNKLKNNCGFTRKGLNSKDQLIKYFLDLTNDLGFVPTYVEFTTHSKIKVHQYISIFSNDKTWESVVRSIVDNELYLSYLKRVKEQTVRIARAGKASQSLLDEKLIESEFKRVFDECYVKYGIYPTRRLFNELSIYSDGAYRKRYKESWNKTVKRYSYPTKNTNPSEKYTLGLISEITGVKYKPQKKWDWLTSNKGTKLPVDGFYEELNLVIEFDGAQHRKPLSNMGGIDKYNIQIENDSIKNTEIPKHGINLIRIDSRDPWYKKEFIEKILIENNIPILNTSQLG